MLTRLRSVASEEDGAGLVELLVVMTLMTIVGSVVLTSLVGGMKANAKTQTRLDALGELQKSVDRMTGPLRAAAPVNFSLSTQGAAQETAVVEVWNANFTAKERITYTYCRTQRRVHMRRQPATTAYAPINCASTTAPVLIDQVSNANTAADRMFTYKMSDGTTDATADSNVYQINVKVRRSLRNHPTPIVVETQVRLRNAR